MADLGLVVARVSHLSDDLLTTEVVNLQHLSVAPEHYRVVVVVPLLVLEVGRGEGRNVRGVIVSLPQCAVHSGVEPGVGAQTDMRVVLTVLVVVNHHLLPQTRNNVGVE